jgi:general secretion pathway protein D
LQVLIEVMIAEVQRSKSFALGVDASTKKTGIKGTKAATAEASQSSGGITGDLVAQIMNLGAAGFSATLTAAAARGDVKILSRPIILAANNEQAQILVGSQRPFVQVSRSLPTDAATRDEVVQYKDVGTKLIVRPTISPDGYVVLEVTQEVNNATNEVAFNAPVISTRSVQTQLLIKDGQTVAIGGLRDRQRDSNQEGIPLLSSIPLIGGLFGHANRSTSETELFLFITPRVIRSDEEADSLTAPLLNRAKENDQ